MRLLMLLYLISSTTISVAQTPLLRENVNKTNKVYKATEHFTSRIFRIRDKKPSNTWIFNEEGKVIEQVFYYWDHPYSKDSLIYENGKFSYAIITKFENNTVDTINYNSHQYRVSKDEFQKFDKNGRLVKEEVFKGTIRYYYKNDLLKKKRTRIKERICIIKPGTYVEKYRYEFYE